MLLAVVKGSIVSTVKNEKHPLWGCFFVSLAIFLQNPLEKNAFIV